jgi:hypothetical protein
MDERDLNALIRMASEVDEMESDASHSFQWARAKASRRDVIMQRLTGIGGLAAAACLALMVIMWVRGPQPAPAPTPVAIVTKPEHTVAPLAAAAPKTPEEGSVLLAVFHDADDRCSCVQLRSDALKGRKLTEVGGGELLRTAIATACHENPEKVLVLAMTGPKEVLPRSTAEAEVLATCITENGRCGDDSICYASSAQAYLPPGVTVVAETLGMDHH